MRPPVRVAVALCAALLAVLAAGPAAAAPRKPAALLEAYLKARKPAEREAAWAEIVAAPPLDPAEVPDLARRAVDLLHRTGRKLKSGRDEWFDEETDGWKGLYMTQGKGKRGLVLGLHGGGQGAGDCGSSASAFGGHVSSLKMAGVFPEVLVRTEYGWTDPPETERWVLELLKAARRTWDTDPNRVYVTGHSMGGYGTWTYGAIHADLFAGAAAFAGAPTVYWKPGRKDVEAEGVAIGILPNLYNLPLFCFQSTDDPRVRPAANQRAFADLAELRKTDPKGWEFLYEEVDDRGHGFPSAGPRAGLEWIAAHERNPRPRKIVWEPVRQWKHTFYWLRWTDPWLEGLLVAEVDVERNRIDVTLRAPRSMDPAAEEAKRPARVAALSLYVDDRLVDLGREVVVSVDGRERYRGVPEPRLEVLVRSAEEREDPEYVFAREIPLR